MLKLLTHLPLRLLLSVFIFTVPAGYFASKIKINSDLKYLMPQDTPSVVALNAIIERVGGASNLVIGIESDDYKASQKFIEALVERIRSYPQDEIRYVEYNINQSKSFFEKNKLLYAELEDLQEVKKRLKKKIESEKLAQNPFYFSLENEPYSFDISDIENKYTNDEQVSQYDHFVDGYFFDQERKMAAIIVRPAGSATGIEPSKYLMKKIAKDIESLEPASYHPSIKTHFTGKFKSTVDEYQQLITDMVSTVALCLFLVALAIFAYFQKLRVIFLLTVPLGLAIIWTFAMTTFSIGYLNSQTVFLGSIIIGNGVNTGIILLARFIEEREKNVSALLAIQTAIQTTWKPTLSAAATTSIAFAALSFSNINGLSQFGFIGGIGMLLCWLASYLILPSAILITESIWPITLSAGRKPRWSLAFVPIGNLVMQHYKTICVVTAVCVVAAITLASQFLPHSLEYDFSKLRNRKPAGYSTTNSPNRRIDNIFKRDLSPVAILTHSSEQSIEACNIILEKEAHLPAAERLIDSCTTLESFLPSLQNEKMTELKSIERLLADKSLGFATPKQKQQMNQLKDEINRLSILARDDLPQAISRNFQEKNGALGKFAFVYPKRSTDLSDGKILIQFVDMLSDIQLSDGSKAMMSGEYAIFTDLLKTIKNEGPWLTLLSFICVALMIIFQFRTFAPIAYVLSGLLIGVTFMLGLQSYLHIKFNFFNFIALPITFGIGVDYGVNFYQRYISETKTSVENILVRVGSAITLCSLTTIIGYSTLLGGINRTLASFGKLSLIGEIACLLTAIFIMPAFLRLFQKTAKV